MLFQDMGFHPGCPIPPPTLTSRVTLGQAFVLYILASFPAKQEAPRFPRSGISAQELQGRIRVRGMETMGVWRVRAGVAQHLPCRTQGGAQAHGGVGVGVGQWALQEASIPSPPAPFQACLTSSATNKLGDVGLM